MKCANCGYVNEDDFKFCGSCGVRLDRSLAGIPCSICGFVNEPNTTFCGGCGETIPRRMTDGASSSVDNRLAPQPSTIGKGHVIGGGIVTAIFSGVFYWSLIYTWEERVWRGTFLGQDIYETVTRRVDPAIQALFLAIAILGAIVMIYGLASKK